MSLSGTDDKVEALARSELPDSDSDIRDVVRGIDAWNLRDEKAEKREESSRPSRVHSGKDSGLIRRCYGSVRSLVGSRTGPRDHDIQPVVTSEERSQGGKELKKRSLPRNLSRGIQSRDKQSTMQESKSHDSATVTDRQSTDRYSTRASSGSLDSSRRILSDEENERMDRNIERLVTAIDDGRLIHFEPDIGTGEVDIFANQYGEVIGHEDQEGDELERDIAASPENFGRIGNIGNEVGRMRSLDSLQCARSSNSWVSTDSEVSHSSAWGRAAAAANTRFTQECEEVDHSLAAIRRPFRIQAREIQVPGGRRPGRKISAIPLDYHKPLRVSTPSIHSNESELDTSSPSFGKSCKRILRKTYAEPPRSSFRRESTEYSHPDGWRDISEPGDSASLKGRVLNAPSGIGRSFGVFQDRSNGESPLDRLGKSALRSKVLKDVSNLRRPGYLQFNSFAKDAVSAGDQLVKGGPSTAAPNSFGGASNQKSRRAYINKKWPGLLGDRNDSRMYNPPQLDGVARRRNEQIVGRPIDRSLYALSHTGASESHFSANVDSARQAHFDLALARLEGRALPPPPSPITRCPDWAALNDCDIEVEGANRPLPLHEPAPHRRPRRFLWRYLR